MSNIALTTYTNSRCHDVLRIHLGQITRFATKFNSFVFTDKSPDFDVSNHQTILYDDSLPYYKQWIHCLENVKEDYVIYLQEDFFLYDDVDYSEINRCKEFLKNSEYSFVRFAKFELQRGVHDKNFALKEFPDLLISDKIYDAYTLDKDCFSFMMQATLWKKQDFIRLYNHVCSEKWLESSAWDKGLRDLKIKGAFHHDSTKKFGKFHWESKIWPHICTAVGKGKWNLTHHDNKLTDILRQYNIDPYIRGIR